MAALEDEGDQERVLRHFPDLGADVLSLAMNNVQFRDMCAELKDAERALEYVRTAQIAQQEERLAECAGWIDRLMAEMREALKTANVVPLNPWPVRVRS